jgi:hypothetical protein
MTCTERGEGVGVSREIVESVWIGLEGVEDIDVMYIGKLGEGYFTTG